MKILAHSVVPTNPLPYLHLGYVSAGFSERPTTRYAGYLQVIQGSLLLAVIGLALLAAWGKRSRARVGVAIGFFTAAVVVFITAFVIRQPPYYPNPVQVTNERLFGLIVELWDEYRYGTVISERLTDYPLSGEAKANGLTDGWFHPMTIERRMGKKHEMLCLVSAGPDGRLDTADDLSREIRVRDITKERMKYAGEILAGKDPGFYRRYRYLAAKEYARQFKAGKIPDGWGVPSKSSRQRRVKEPSALSAPGRMGSSERRMILNDS